jgi:predicted deacylase
MPSLDAIRATLPAYPIEVSFPDLSRWRKGNVGIDYIHSFDSGVRGPHVMLMALVHGNEVCGAIVVDMLLDMGLRPAAGRLSLGLANVGAYETFDPACADAARYVDEDMNRVWGDALDGDGDSLELRRARAMRPFLDTVDLLLDLHSMHEASPPLMMCGSLEKGARLAAAVNYPEHVVIDAGHASGSRLRDYASFGHPTWPHNALLIEAGQHFSQSSVEVALESTGRFLVQSGVVESASVRRLLKDDRPLRQRFIEVTHPIVAGSMEFAFARPFKGLEIIPEGGTVIAFDGHRPIVTPYDNCVLVQPSLRHLGPGNTVARLGRLVDPGRRAAG